MFQEAVKGKVRNVGNQTLETRFWAKVRKTETCWMWTACLLRDGYGLFSVNGALVRAHRFAYELLVGPIPQGFTLDHLCRSRACVRPEHLEPVTNKDNVLRGNGLTALNARKTQCPQGHPYDLFNTHCNLKGGRVCRECRKRESRELRQRKRACSVAMKRPIEELFETETP